MIPQRSYRTDYLQRVFDTPLFIRMVNRVARKIKTFRKKNPFQAIAFTGVSSSAYAYALSYKLKIPLVHIRKGGEKSHYGGCRYEGSLNFKKYIIVDDFIESGKTIDKIITAVRTHSPQAQLVGIFLYCGTSCIDSYKDVPVFDLD